MKLCIPTYDDHGLGATVADHFGRAPFLTIVDEESGAVEVVRSGPHTSGCRPAARLEGHAIDAVVGAGIGRRALAVLQGAGYRVLVSPGPTVSDVLAASKAGRLVPFSPETACGGHHQVGCAGHHHRHRRGGR